MKIIQSELQYQNLFILISFLLMLGVACSSAEINHGKFKHHHAKGHHLKIHKKAAQHLNKKEASDSNDQYKRTLPPNIWTLLAENSAMNLNQSDGSKYTENDETSQNEINTDNMDFEPVNGDESNKKSPFKCPKCEKNSVKMSEDELTNLRIEYVKNQILHKLRMNERPPKKSIDELPEPIQEGYAIQSEDNTDYLNRRLDDYFAKTTQKIIFLTQGLLNYKHLHFLSCSFRDVRGYLYEFILLLTEFEKCKSHDYPSVCFTFQIPADLDDNIVESAHLWIYKEPSK